MPTAIVLVVEDNSIQQIAIEELFKKFDYGVQIVASGEAAIAALAVMSYAAILMDLCLPGIDGLECTRRIRSSELGPGKHTPIIAVTASADSSKRDDCLAAGMDDFLSKPFSSEQLRRILLRHVYDPDQPNLKTLRPLPP